MSVKKNQSPVWDQLGRLKDDNCTIKLDEKQSKLPGSYQLSGYDGSYQYISDYVARLDEPMHFQKVYRSDDAYVDEESYLWLAELNNMRYKNQLFTRPYVGYFCGPGQPSIGNKDLESALQQGLLTNLRQKPCESSRGKTGFNFMCLPEYGNPQNPLHCTNPPVNVGGWGRYGLPTRDLVRRIDYQRRCFDHDNNQKIHKTNKNV